MQCLFSMSATCGKHLNHSSVHATEINENWNEHKFIGNEPLSRQNIERKLSSGNRLEHAREWRMGRCCERFSFYNLMLTSISLSCGCLFWCKLAVEPYAHKPWSHRPKRSCSSGFSVWCGYCRFFFMLVSLRVYVACIQLESFFSISRIKSKKILLIRRLNVRCIAEPLVFHMDCILCENGFSYAGS